jgi:hypothetical protein
MIPSYQCTFCIGWMQRIDQRCPNCGGNFAPHPIRPVAALLRHPGFLVRVSNPAGCT